MKLTMFVLAMSLTAPLIAQNDKEVDSRITDVTVFLDKAQVTREVKTRVENGKTNLILTGLSSLLEQQSIQVSGKGNIVILGIAHQLNYLNELNLPKGLTLLKDSIEFYQNQVGFTQSQLEILNKEEQMLMSNQKIGGTSQNLTAAELKTMADFYRSRLFDIVNSRMKANEKVKAATKRIATLQQQVNERTDIYSRNTSEIVVSVSANEVASVSLEVKYIVPNAGWQPVYDLRAINTKSPVQLNYKANVYQSTGEDWKNVKLKLSTANPSLGGLKPELDPWYLNFYMPVSYRLQGKVAGIQMAPSMAGASEDKKMEEEEITTVANYVTTIQTTLNTEFVISLPYTVSSSSKPTLVDIKNYEMKADYQYAVTPKLDQDAFLIANATGWEDFNLLPGEANVFFEGTFVGKSFIDPNSIKDTLAISLGRDKRIVVKREKLKDFSSRKFIGLNQRDNYTYEISVRNTKNEAVKIVIEDQIPVSQNEQIEVTLGDVNDAVIHSDTGKLTWELVVQPNETKKVNYKFEIKFPKDKQVAGL
jgi:uncharacterized protein (TIGR02231 family)